MSSARFAYTIVYVPNVERAIAFYRAAFGCEVQFVAPDGTYGELSTGDVTLAFATESLGEQNLPHGFLRHSPANPPFGTELAFVTDDVPATLAAAVDAGARVVAEPTVKPWGQTVGWVRDPDGVLVEIATHVE
jgi:lactoylglutathione lyase